MPAINIASILGKKAASKDYGFMVDQLDMMKNQLEADGKLAPGDYDLLSKEAQKIYSHPGLSVAQKSNVMVKISSFQSDKQKTTLGQRNDIQRLNNELKDDKATIGMAYGNNPEMLVRSSADALLMKLNMLTQSINGLQNAGDDATAHMIEYNSAKQDYYDLLGAYEDVKNYKGAGRPTGNYVAYVDTNPRGEIINVNIGRIGSKTGYYETNGLYGGLQIYGNKTRKEGDKIVFKIGNTEFDAADIMTPGIGGEMKSAVLTVGGYKSGGRRVFTGEKYQDVDLNQVPVQSAFRTGDWVEGQFLYQKTDNGFVKYANPDKTKMGISDNMVMPIPKYLENSILNNVSETVDSSELFAPPIPGGQLNIPSPASTTAVAPAPTTSLTQKIMQGAAPTERAPQTAAGTASRVFEGAKSFLSTFLKKGINIGQ